MRIRTTDQLKDRGVRLKFEIRLKQKMSIIDLLGRTEGSMPQRGESIEEFGQSLRKEHCGSVWGEM